MPSYKQRMRLKKRRKKEIELRLRKMLMGKQDQFLYNYGVDPARGSGKISTFGMHYGYFPNRPKAVGVIIDDLTA